MEIIIFYVIVYVICACIKLW